VKIPENVRGACGYEDDDDFQPNTAALQKIMNGYAVALQMEVRANRHAIMYGNGADACSKKAIWRAAVVATLEDVLALFLHESPARGLGPHEAETLDLHDEPSFGA